MQDSVFTKIIKGEIPSYKVYEDAKTLAFLDIEPLSPGHTLVVPKLQVDQFDELPAEDYQALFRTVQKVSRHARTILGTKRTIIQVLGFDIPHTHIHIIPADSGMEYYEAIGNHVANVKDSRPYPYKPTSEELAAMAAKLRLEDGL
ncbi:MAG TPA: HIT domain-containing protein [Candidatus Saccharimonadales bacterium]|jgi:histidine triad (HIT) family protein